MPVLARMAGSVSSLAVRPPSASARRLENPTSSIPSDCASPRAVATPTRRPVKVPGPRPTAIRSSARQSTFARVSSSSTIPSSRVVCPGRWGGRVRSGSSRACSVLPGPVTQVIERERPDALLGTLGGQTALNLAKAFHDDGTLERFGVELIGANYEAIACAEDREQFGVAMARAGLEMPNSVIATTVGQADAALSDLGLPCIVRPAYTLGGRGGGIARTPEEFRRIVAQGIESSPIGQVLLDQSVIGWGEFELEVMRDNADNVVIVCSIENIDPMGVHTGDSVTVAPQQTLTDPLYQRLRDQAIAVIRAVGVETGGSNVQFAVNPETEEILVIEMNPRVSRSSALASKATGFPIAKIAARLAVGYLLEEIDNDITGVTPACFEPTIDYVVVKWPGLNVE